MRTTACSLLVLVCLLCACGDGDSNSSAATPGTTPGTSVTTASTGSSGSSGTPTSGATGTDTPGGSSGGSAGGSSGGASGSSGGGETSTGAATNMTTVDPSAGSSSSGGAPDCDADCKSCWDCARAGACKDVYDACANAGFCIPSLTCIGSMCTPEGIQPDCATTCCMGCVNLMTCKEVNAAVSCIEAQCAGLCGAQLCPG